MSKPVYDDLGLTSRQAETLYTIAKALAVGRPATFVEIAQESGLPYGSSVSSVVDALVRKGFVAKTDPGKGRSMRILKFPPTANESAAYQCDDDVVIIVAGCEFSMKLPEAVWFTVQVSNAVRDLINKQGQASQPGPVEMSSPPSG